MYSKKEIEDAKVIIRYLIFYGAVIFILSITSYLLDLVFHFIYKGNVTGYPYSAIQYIPYFIIYGFMIFPISIFYNYFINNILRNELGIRLAVGFFTAILCVIVLSRDLRFGYYIGEQRTVKNLIAVGLSGVLIELLRFGVVTLRNRNRLS